MSTPKNDVDAWATTLEHGHSVPFTLSRGKTALTILLCLLFVLIALAFALLGDTLVQIVGWIAALLFLGLAVFHIRRLFVRTPAVTVSPEGITMTSAGAGLIPWSQILEVDAMKQDSVVQIVLAVTEQEAERQAPASIVTGERELEDGSTQKVLLLPVGIAASKPALTSWLDQEHRARTTTPA
ncbi:STM3941 family protein [Brachybacterium sp. FME24]|uniref:STM3941 family protein n=1 Tax=Brachybacterium sp. FME24 TaxID=2742605 RepID=UPI0018695266|nr:STM3941 family protein [Brachybacterium sp. FME24]